MTNHIDKMYVDFSALENFLHEKEQLSFTSFINENARKILVLATASFFEKIICDEIERYCSEAAHGNLLVISFIKRKAVARQYHTFFEWKNFKDGKGAITFFSLFGDNFKQRIKFMLEQENEFRENVSAFLELGQERNRLVHQDLGSYTLEKTSSEIYSLYKKAFNFVIQFPILLRENFDSQNIKDYIANET